MLLKNYDEPSDEELEVAFQAIYHMMHKLHWPERILVWMICKLAGDRLYTIVARMMHGATMQTLHLVECGVYSDVFKRKREMRKSMKQLAKDFVQSEEEDLTL